MDISLLHKFCWIVGLTFVILPLINPGLLSDYKICGDSECESLMSRVQAIRDHRSNDCSFLSFSRGDIIFVYHKLTGKREDLWAGSIDKQFGYFPKDAVEEEQVFATMETAVETQKSDFFCMDEFGYPIDSDDDNNQETPKEESNINVITEYFHETNPKGPLTSNDLSAKSSVTAQQIDGPKALGDEADPPEEVHEIHAASSKQGGSASSSWLSSSVTGWFGVEQLDELPKGEGEDEKTENKDETSLTSSVKGWLGFERNSEPGNADESVTIPDQATDTIASTVTGWFSFGGKKRSEDEQNKHDGEETDEGIEPAEKYRGRRMSLDLEGSQLHEEEKTEMGTLGWLGSKLSSGMGYGLTNQNAGEENKEKEKQEYRFWPTTGIGDMLGFGKKNEKVDQDIKIEKEQGNALEEPQKSHNVETKVLEAPQMDEAKTETSKLPKEEDVLKDPYTQSPEDVKVDSTDTDNYKVDNEDALDRNEINIQRNEDELQVDELNEKFQMNAEMPYLNSRISLRENKEKKDSEEIQVKESRSEEMVNKGKEIFKSVKNWEQDTTNDLADEEVTATDNNPDFIKSSCSQSWNEESFNKLLSNSLGRSQGKDAQQSEKQEFVKVTTKEYSPAESTDIESKSSDDKMVEGKDFTQKEKAIEENQVSGNTEAATELIQDDVSFTPDDKLNLTATYSNSSDTGSHQDKSQIEEEAKSVWGTSKEFGSFISAQDDESLSEYPSKENNGKVSSSDRTSTIYKEPAVNSINTEEMTNPHEQVEKETLGFGEDVMSQSDLKSTPRPETETKKIEMLRGEIETNEKGNHSKTEEKQELNDDKEKVDEMKDKQQTDMEGKKKEDNVELKVRGEKMEATMEEEKDKSASKDEEVAELKEEEEHQVNKVKQKVEQQADNEKQTLLKEEQLVMMEDTMESEEANIKEKDDEKKNLQNVEMERIYNDRSTKTLDSNQKEGTGDSLSSTAGTVTESENQELEIENKNKKETQDVDEVINKRMEMNEVDEEADPLKCPNCPKEQESAVTEEHEEKGRSADEMVGVEEQKDRGDDTGERQVTESRGNDDSEMQGIKIDDSTSGSEVHSVGREPSEAPFDKADSQTSHVSEEYKRGLSTREGAESETKESFGLFRKAFSFFRQTPTTDSNEFVELTNTFNNSSGETPEQQMQEPPPTTDSPQQVSTPSPTKQPYPPSAEINILHGAALTTDPVLERKTLTGQYNNLLHHMDMDKLTVLTELFGRHRLEILDYILTSPEAETEKVDLSILSDMESLLHYHREILVSSSVRTADATQEDKEKTRTLVALQKIEMLLKTVKKTSDINNHKAESFCDSTSCSAEDIDKKANIQDLSAIQDDNIHREEQMVEEKPDGFMDKDMVKERNSVEKEMDEKRRNEERQSPPHSQTQGGAMRHIVDLLHHVRVIILWLTMQVGGKNKFIFNNAKSR